MEHAKRAGIRGYPSRGAPQQDKERQTTFEGVAALFMEHYVERELRANTAREYRRTLQGPDTRLASRPVTSLARQTYGSPLSD